MNPQNISKRSVLFATSVFAAIRAADNRKLRALDACAFAPFGRSVEFEFRSVSGERPDMTGAIFALSHRLRPWAAAICLGAMLVSIPAFARGPDGIADVAEKVIDAVVNISTTQTVEAKGGDGGRGAMPQLPPGSPFEEFFDDFFKNRRGPGGDKGGGMQPRKTNSLGSGF